MAIPDNPNWSALTDVKPYPQPAFEKPLPVAPISSISLGPIALSDSKGKLNSRYWTTYQDGSNVVISGGSGSGWGSPTILFSEPTPILIISLTFDQLGRPLIFYMVDPFTLKLYWYDPVIQDSVNVQIATGYDPIACFDFPQDTGQSFTDAILFYVRDDRVYMRVQRDRFGIEYDTGAIHEGLRLVSAGLRVDNRLQVEYIWPESEELVYDLPNNPPPVVVNNTESTIRLRERLPVELTIRQRK